ncbi:hypothetical protein FRC06_011077 [Ceratobasidium sp. 370]|nr:hypothetical protein FRC06_011077 [Ceratobasidium sp. 370]
MSSLKNMSGALHIGLDMYQSDNRQDYLGIVLYHQVVERETIRIKRMVLECLGWLARTTRRVLQKFETEHRVWGAVGDGTSTNEAMMKFMMPAHVLNLVAQAVAALFRKPLARSPGDDGDDDEDDEDEDEPDNECDGDENSDASGGIEDKDVDLNDLDGDAESWALDPDDDEQGADDFDEEVEDYDLPAIVPGSDDADEAKAAAKVGRKLAWWAKRLRFSTAFKGVFVGNCVKLEVKKPHNIRRDIRTRWNLTGKMSSDGERTFLAIMKTQRNSTFREEDLVHIKHLNMLFQAFTIVTEIASHTEIPMLADVIVHYNSLNYTYGKICSDTSLPLYVRHAANHGRKVLNKYYTKTNTSHLYQLSILLHPGLQAHYLCLVKWEEEFYKLANALLSAPAQPTLVSQFGYSPYRAHLFGADTMQDKPTPCPVCEFVNGAIIWPMFDANHNPIFCIPLQWWYSQRVAGNDMDRLTQMALDVLTTPATSVDVEQFFSFVGSTVSKRWHKLSVFTIQATTMLGCYAKSNMVPPGCLITLKMSKNNKSLSAVKE